MYKENQAVSQQSSIELPKFNEIIKVEVDVQDIFNKLLSEFPEEYKHRELVAHAVIGSTKDNSAIGFIYNALNGYSPLIDFKVNELVECKYVTRNVRYDSNVEDENGEQIGIATAGMKPNWKNRQVAIGKCKVLEINLYASDKLKVEFEQDNRYGEGKETVSKWVNHKFCTNWASLNV